MPTDTSSHHADRRKDDSASSLRASFMLGRGVVGCRLCQVPDLRLYNKVWSDHGILHPYRACATAEPEPGWELLSSKNSAGESDAEA